MHAPFRSSFSPGTARGLAAAVGIPADLAISGGEPAVCAMMELKRARDAGGGGLRGHHLAQAQQHIASLDSGRHGTLMQRLQACALAMGGRGGDTRIAHVTPGEVVVPESILTPDVVAILRRAAKEKSIDPSRFVVGSGRNVINPNTGQMEFDEDGENDSEAPNVNGQAIPGNASNALPITHYNSGSPPVGLLSNGTCPPGTSANLFGPPDYSGMASMYGENANGTPDAFAHQTTANGETMDPNSLTAASVRLHDASGNLLKTPLIPMGSYVNVVSQADPSNNVVVRVNDSGPLKPGRILDLSPTAMETLTGKRYNMAPVNVFNCKP